MSPHKVVSFLEIPKKAFEYWNKTILFQLLFSLCYFTVYIVLTYYVFEYYGVLNDIHVIFGDSYSPDLEVNFHKYMEIIRSENFEYVVFWIIVIKALLFPMNLGLFNIYRKIDKQEPLFIRDLFSGFEGNIFFKYFGYALFWEIMFFVFQYTIILAFLLVMLTLFVGPLIYLNNMSISQALSLSMKAVSKNIVTCFLTIILGFIFRYIGIFFLVGILLTFSFWNALLYAYYKKVFPENNYYTIS